MRASIWKPHLWAVVAPILLTALAYLVGLLVLGYLPGLIWNVLGR